MWCQRRTFSLTSTPERNQDHAPDAFVTVFDYCVIPFSSQEQFEQSRGWYRPALAVDEAADAGDAPSRDSADNDALDNDDFAVSWDDVPQCLEWFVVGWSDGSVERHRIIPSRVALRLDACPFAACLELQRHSDYVMHLHTLGLLVATASVDGTVRTRFLVSPEGDQDALMRRAPVILSHHSPVRCVRLWEGIPQWCASSNNEDGASVGDSDSVVYLLSGDDCGRVRLWRVDLGANATPSLDGAPTGTLLRVFGCAVYGRLGDANSMSEEERYASATLCREQNIFSVDVVDNGSRLVACGVKRIFVWNFLEDHRDDTARVHPQPQREADDEWESFRTKCLLGSHAAEPSTLNSVSSPTPCGRAGGGELLSPPSTTPTVAQSRWYNRYVWLDAGSPWMQSTTTTCSSVGSGGEGAEINKNKKKVDAVMRRRQLCSQHVLIGQVTNISLSSTRAHHCSALCTSAATTTTSSDEVMQSGCVSQVQQRPSHPVLWYEVSFPGMKQPLLVPGCGMQRVHLSTLSFEADDSGPIYGIAPLHEGFFASGGADGWIRLWNWSEATERYELLRRVCGHRDIIKTIQVVKPPLLFATASLDGFVKTWRVGSGVTLAEESRVLLTATMAADTRVAAGGAAPEALDVVGVAGAVLHADFFALFALEQMSATLRTLAWWEVDTCAPPPTLCFNGQKTVPVPPQAVLEELPLRTEAGCGPSEGGSAHTRTLEQMLAETAALVAADRVGGGGDAEQRSDDDGDD